MSALGTGISVSCKKCNYTNQFLLGVGFYHSCFEKCIDCLHPKTRTKLLEHINEEKIIDYEFQHKLFRCIKCSKLYSRPYMKVWFGTNDCSIETNINCSCKGKGVEVGELDINDIPCPECNHNSLTETEHILWD